MTDNILPASPNWYCSKVGDTNEHGDLAFGAKSAVYLLNTRANPPTYVGTLTSHTDKVTSVVFCKHSGHGTLCCTAADDCFVKLWDSRAAVVLNEHRLHQNKITCLDWSILDKELVISGDEKGAIICWNYTTNESTQIVPDYGYIYCIACSPHDVKHCAVGYKQGNILLIDISNGGNIIHKLRGHDDEIHSLAWSPTTGEDIIKRKEKLIDSAELEPDESDEIEDDTSDSASSTGCLLASGSRDRTIRFWSVSKGKAVLTLKLPGKASGFKGKMDDTSKARVWVALYWPKNKPREIVSSSHGGDLLFWDICKPGKQKWRLIGQGDGKGHNRIIFTVLHGGDANSNSVITMSMDRQIILWNLASSKAVYCVPTLGGYVYSMVSSPIDVGRLAVGVGDNMIRIWNTSSPVNAYDVTVLWQGTRSKVTALCWHPFKEGHLAYGTDDGRVGIYDVFAQKPPNISSSYHKKTVYSVGWGPPCPGTGGKSGGVNQNVYSCGGDGIILQHNPYRIYDDAEDINNLIKKSNDIRHKIPQRTELAWKPDESVLAIGNDDGSVEIFLAPNLLLLCSIHVHYKIINCVRWYPDWTNVKASNQSQKHQPGVSSDHDQSNCRNWLAVGSNDPPIHIYDLTDILVSRSAVRTPITSSYCTLNGHTQRVTGLSWSPHGDQKLVSVSYDGTAQVWDVSKGEPISNYRGHHGRLFSVVWSGTSHETIYTGGEDFTVQRWRVSQQEHTKPPKSRRTTQLFLQKGGKSRSKNKSKQKNETKDSHEVKKSVSPAVPQSVTPSNDELQTLEELVEQKIEELKSTQTNVHEVKVQDNETINVPVTENMPQDKSHMITSQLLDDVQIDLKEVQDEKERKTVDVAMETGSTGSGAKRAAFEKRKRRQKSLLPKSSFLDNRGRNFMQEDCKMLAQSLYTEDTVAGFMPGIADQCNMGLFADRKAAFRLFNEEGSYHMEQGNLENYLQLEIWKGNIGKAIQVAKERGQLNEWLVSMAPLGGHDLWLQTAEAYARQLCSQELYLKASSYLVACHKVYDAIEVLKEHKFIKEAVALAKVRLSPSDPVLIELYQTWASQLENDGNFEFAAKCYLAAHQACDAVRLLSRRGDIPALRAACQVALYTNEQEQATSLALQCANQCQENADWLTAHNVLSGQKNVQVYQLQLIVHQELVKTLLKTKSVSSSHYQDAHFAEWKTDDATIPEWMASLSQSVREYLQPMVAEEGHCWWAAHTVNKEPFYSHVMKIWSHVYHHQITKEDFSDCYRTLSATKQMKGGQLNQREVLSHVSYDMTLALLSIMTSQISTALGHWHQAITVCHERGFYDIEQVLFRIVATHGFATFKFLEQSVESSEEHVTCDDSCDGVHMLDCLRAHYCLLSLYEMWWSGAKTATESDFDQGSGDAKGGGDHEIRVQPAESEHSANNTEDPTSIVQAAGDAACMLEQASISTDGTIRISDQNGKPESVEPKSSSDSLDTDGLVCEYNTNTNKIDEVQDFGHRDAIDVATPSDVPGTQAGYCPYRDTNSKEMSPTNLGHIISKLDAISKALLSDLHAAKFASQTKLQYIQKAVKGLIAQQKKQSRKEQRQKRALRKKEQSQKLEKEHEKEPKSSQTDSMGSRDETLHDVKVSESVLSQADRLESDLSEKDPPVTGDDEQSVARVDISKIQPNETGALNTVGDKLNSSEMPSMNICDHQTPETRPEDENSDAAKAENDPADGKATVTGAEADPEAGQEFEDGHDDSRDDEELVLPADWNELPLDVRYSHPAVSMTLLSEEQTQVISHLQQLPKAMKELNFPSPVESAMVLVHYCTYRHGTKDSNQHKQINQCGMEAAQWGLKHSQTSQDIKFFLKHLDKLENDQK